jgi:hypothetical protein
MNSKGGSGSAAPTLKTGAVLATRAASGQAAAAPPESVMKSRRFIWSSARAEATPYHTARRVVHHSKTDPAMSHSGQSQPKSDVRVTSAFLSIATT